MNKKFIKQHLGESVNSQSLDRGSERGDHMELGLPVHSANCTDVPKPNLSGENKSVSDWFYRIVLLVVVVLIGPMFFSFSAHAQRENVNLSFNNGSTFCGVRFKIRYFQGYQTNYYGTLTNAAGERWIGDNGNYGFDENFMPNGYIWYINPSGEIYLQRYQNGKCISSSKETRSYYFDGPFIQFSSDAASGAGGYSGGYYNNSGGSTSGGGGNYNSHQAQCRGCNGTGSCGHCNGTGYVNNRKSKCSLCHGSGRCKSCGGTGRIHGNF